MAWMAMQIIRTAVVRIKTNPIICIDRTAPDGISLKSRSVCVREQIHVQIVPTKKKNRKRFLYELASCNCVDLDDFQSRTAKAITQKKRRTQHTSDTIESTNWTISMKKIPLRFHFVSISQFSLYVFLYHLSAKQTQTKEGNAEYRKENNKTNNPGSESMTKGSLCID
jgi:hypothetical protein